MKIIRIGTRGSKLALWQANYLQKQLESLGLTCSQHIIKTQGDRIQHLGFDKMEGKGFFTKEIEAALIAREIDVAVHSMKDLPTTLPEGLAITAVSTRANPADWLIVRPESARLKALFRLPEDAVVGTSSARRKALLRHFRPDLQIVDLRGNVPTRLGKLLSGNMDAIVLAAAGLERLETDLSGLEVVRLNPKEFVSAPAQGVLAFQVRKDDLELRKAMQPIHDKATAERTNVERKVLQLAGGSCHMPLGVYCEKDPMGHYHVWGALANAHDAPVRFARISSDTSFELAEQVLDTLNR